MVGLLDMKGDDSIRRVYDEEGLCPTLTTMGGGHREPKVLVRACLTPDREAKRQNGRRMKTDDEPMFTLTAQDIHGIALEEKPNWIPGPDDINRTLRTGGKGSLDEKHNYEHVHDGVRIRKLTPLECWRLQGFPDWAHQRAVDAGVSQSQRYKQAGNSVTVNVIAAVAGRLT
jgi:DNA (cytosine-5)-methyltransferase 1